MTRYFFLQKKSAEAKELNNYILLKLNIYKQKYYNRKKKLMLFDILKEKSSNYEKKITKKYIVCQISNNLSCFGASLI